MIQTAMRTGGGLAALALMVGGCALTFDATQLGVPTSLAESAQSLVSQGTPFRITKHPVFLLWGLAGASRPNAEDVLAGQVGLDPAAGRLAEGGTGGEARQALVNITTVLTDCGASWVTTRNHSRSAPPTSICISGAPSARQTTSSTARPSIFRSRPTAFGKRW